MAPKSSKSTYCCPSCAGSGEISSGARSDFGPDWKYDQCDQCKGSGEIPIELRMILHGRLQGCVGYVVHKTVWFDGFSDGTSSMHVWMDLNPGDEYLSYHVIERLSNTVDITDAPNWEDLKSLTDDEIERLDGECDCEIGKSKVRGVRCLETCATSRFLREHPKWRSRDKDVMGPWADIIAENVPQCHPGAEMCEIRGNRNRKTHSFWCNDVTSPKEMRPRGQHFWHKSFIHQRVTFWAGRVPLFARPLARRLASSFSDWWLARHAKQNRRNK